MIRLALIRIARSMVALAIKCLGHVAMHDRRKVTVWLFLGRLDHKLWQAGFNLRFDLIKKGIIK